MSESQPTRSRKQAFNPGERGWIAGNNYDDSVLDSLESENKRLREALEKYGRHKDGCPGLTKHGAGFVDFCECGFNEARALRGE